MLITNTNITVKTTPSFPTMHSHQLRLPTHIRPRSKEERMTPASNQTHSILELLKREDA